MTEKRVSVRLSAVDGQKVRAEIDGIGEAGARGFGRLSYEMEMANTRHGSFARKAGIALAAVTAAAAAAGVAMIRSGLDTIGAQVDMARSTGPIGTITALFDNIGRLTTYAATFAAVMAGRWVEGLAAAALSVSGLATGLVILRGALIVGAGELVFQFIMLVSGAGGFGNAMGLLKDVVIEVWERIKMGATAVGAAATAMFSDIKADAASGMQSPIESVVGFGNTAANTFEGTFEAIKSIWGLLPAAIGDLAFQAANSLIEGVESMLNGVVAGSTASSKGSTLAWKRWGQNAGSRFRAIWTSARSRTALPGRRPAQASPRRTHSTGFSNTTPLHSGSPGRATKRWQSEI